MFNESLFRYILNKNGRDIKYAAKIMGISITTLYRKMAGESDFMRKEIRLFAEAFPDDDLMPVFFSTKVS
ncbi:MAG: hypothetical protein LBS36_13680 [Oscillospiraceae bacterium]|jgi:hypothetical protein|nr:hypothetical protein [Oscillospiraceae bacterium]